MLYQQNVKPIHILRQHKTLKQPVCLLHRNPGANQPQPFSHAKNMRIYRQSWHTQREKQYAASCFHAHAGQLPQPIPGFIYRQLPQEIQFEATLSPPYFLQRLLDIPGFNYTQSTSFNRMGNLTNAGISHIFPIAKRSQKLLKSLPGVPVRRVLGKNRLDQHLYRTLPPSPLALPILSTQ
jgi:hypothetical protein